MTDGTFVGATETATGMRPGQKIVHRYTGQVGHGYILNTYLSAVDSYWVDPLVEMDSTATTRPYFTNVYKVAQPYGRVYLSVYQGYTQGDGGSQLTGGTVKVNSLILGNR